MNKVGNRIKFFTPISFELPSSFQRAVGTVDGYFCLGGRTAVITQERRFHFKENYPSLFKTILKVVSYFTIMVPVIMLMIKYILRYMLDLDLGPVSLIKPSDSENRRRPSSIFSSCISQPQQNLPRQEHDPLQENLNPQNLNGVSQEQLEQKHMQQKESDDEMFHSAIDDSPNLQAKAIEKVQENGLALQNLDPLLQNTKVVMAAILQNPAAFQFASSELRKNQELALAAVARDWRMLEYVTGDLNNQKDLVWLAVKQDLAAFKLAGSEARRDKEIATYVFSQDGGARLIEFAGPNIQRDQDIAVLVWRGDGEAFLKYIHPSCKDDPVVMGKIVEEDGTAIILASDRLRDDPWLARKAIQNNWLALGGVSDRLQNDPGIVNAAIKENPAAKQFMGPELAEKLNQKKKGKAN